MGLDFWANVATIISLPISIIAIAVGGIANCKIDNYIKNNQNNLIKKTKIKDSVVTQNNTRS